MCLCVHAVSTPVVTLSLAPDPSLVAGGVGDTVLTCTAMVDRAVVNRGTLEYAFTWRDIDSNTIVSGGRTIVSTTAPSPSQSSNLTLSPLSTADTSFTCAVVVTVTEDTLVPSEPGVTSTAVNVTSESVRPLTIVSHHNPLTKSMRALSLLIIFLKPFST